MSTGDHWDALKRFTGARIGLGRAGSALPTCEVLKFSMAHAQARDAVTTPIDWVAIEAGLKDLEFRYCQIHSAARNLDEYLRRPDLGRRMSEQGRETLAALSGGKPDLAIVVGDGLSSTAVTVNVLPFLQALVPYISANKWKVSPVVLVTRARVAVGDEAGEYLDARAVVVLIGERPGLSSPDSLGAYLTYAPRIGRKDAERNCISNIRVGGLSYDEAAFKLAWLLREALRREITGVQLKDESNFQLENPVVRQQLT